MNDRTGPLKGIRILDFSTVVSGPMATQMLADQGAEVIKVEASPRGDMGRATGSSRGGMSAAFHMYNRGKRSITLDLKTEAGVEVAKRLVGETDVLVHNFRPKVMGRLGLGYDDLRADFPDLIYVSISGFGDKGPLADRPVYDHIIQAYSGLADLQGGKDGEPSLVRSIIFDKLTAVTASQAITAAILGRERGGGGQEVTLSLLSSAVAFMWADALPHLHLIGEGGREMPALADYCRLYAFKNGYATFSPTDRSFEGMCRDFDAPAGNDPRLARDAGRVTELELMAEVERQWESAMAEMDIDEGMALLEKNDVPCGKVRRFEDLVGDPQVEANGLLRDYDHPICGPIREPAPAAQFSATPTSPTTPAPMLGEHTEEIAAALGIDAAEMARLRERGAFG